MTGRQSESLWLPGRAAAGNASPPPPGFTDSRPLRIGSGLGIARILFARGVEWFCD